MGRHSTPRGEYSSKGQANASPQSEGYRPKRLADETAGHDDHTVEVIIEDRLRIAPWISE